MKQSGAAHAGIKTFVLRSRKTSLVLQASPTIYFDLPARTFAQRALAAREIFRRAAALIFRRLRRVLAGDDEALAATVSSCD